MARDHILDEKIFRILHGKLIDEFIERNQVHLPGTFVPSARYVAIGNHELLWLADPMTFTICTRRPRRWVKYGKAGSFQTLAHRHFLWAHSIPVATGSEKIWFLQRQRLWQPAHEVLAFKRGPTQFSFAISNTRWLSLNIATPVFGRKRIAYAGYPNGPSMSEPEK